MKTLAPPTQLKEMAKKLGLKLRDVESMPLEGLWEDVKLTDRDIEEAKKVPSGRR